MKQIFLKSSAIFVIIFITSLFVRTRLVESTPSKAVKDTLSSAQLSYFARLGTGNTANDSIVKIALNGNPSNTTANLFKDDVIGIGRSNALGFDKYTVRDIGNTGFLEITTPLAAINALNGNILVATRSAIHSIAFTPQSTTTGGKWQFLIKATNRVGENPMDGIPDQAGFDLGSDVGTTIAGIGTRLKNTDVSCPWGATASVGTTAVVNGNSYHVIECSLGAGITNPVDVGATITIGKVFPAGTQLINPSAALSHVEGTASGNADVYTFFVRHTDSAGVLIDGDTAMGKIAVVEAVRVTATVDPTLTFSITTTGVGVGSTACGNSAFGSNASNTTPSSANFGSLALGVFNNLAHNLSCVTNADGGYVVQVYEESNMKNINSGTTIPDTNCDGACTATTANTWASVDAARSEWGYGIQNVSVGTTYVGTNKFRPFGLGSANAQPIMGNNSTPIQTESAFICYRISVTTVQEAGNYENKLVYTATATF